MSDFTYYSEGRPVMGEKMTIATELRRVCGHDSRSVDGCLHCEAADALEATHLTPPAQAVDVGALRELNEWLLAQEGMHVDPDHVAEAITRALAGEKAEGLPWVSIDAQRPERNKPAIYWHKSEFGGFAAIADEWRDEHHLAHASHWLPYTPPTDGEE